MRNKLPTIAMALIAICLVALQVAFILLKAMGIWDVSWGIVLIPVWVSLGAFALVWLAAFVCAICLL